MKEHKSGERLLCLISSVIFVSFTIYKVNLGKNMAKVEPLLLEIIDVDAITTYAKAEEDLGNYAEAIKAYERVRKWEKVVEINIFKLGNTVLLTQL